MKRLVTLLCLLPLCGCIGITFGRVSIDHGAAMGVRFVSIGLWSACGHYGAGIAAGFCVSAKPGESVAVLNGHRLAHITYSLKPKEVPNETAIPTAGADR